MKRGHKNSHRDLTAKILRSVLRYDPSTGRFIWIKSLGRRKSVGKIAGWKQAKGRVKIGIKGIEYMAHRLAWLYMKGQWPKFEIDHINENQSDNRWINLRHATPSQNHRNRGKQYNNSTGYKGVCKPTGKDFYVAGIKIYGKRHHLGCFTTAKEAYKSYCLAAKKYHGRFAKTFRR